MGSAGTLGGGRILTVSSQQLPIRTPDQGNPMGWSFRKSIRLGPLRVNLSKSGIGLSGGVKGARISVGPRGTRLYGGWGPFRYQKQLSSSGGAKGQSQPSQTINSAGCGGCLILCLFSFLGLVVLVNLAGCPNKNAEDVRNATSTPTQSIKEPAPRAPAAANPSPLKTEQPVPIFDVPPLLGESVDKIQSVLNIPAIEIGTSTETSRQSPASQGKLSFTKGGETLIVTFDATTRRALSFFLPGTDRKRLLMIGHLTLDGDYSLEFTDKGDDTHQLPGVRIGLSESSVSPVLAPKVPLAVWRRCHVRE
jgi:hypothetical protein